MKTKEEVLEIISNVKHPAIDYSLVDLGMIKNIEVKDNIVKLIFVFPFPNIPIADALINSIAMPLRASGYELEHEIVVMTEEEKATFMRMETEAWRG
ncbi:MAG: iron-sulfur cluster assembly protein [Bacteroidota bacterium]|nr:iron-sulfur cluster assembly protein [Bacteroidota bacterium]